MVLIAMGTENICFGTFSIVNSTFPNFYYYNAVGLACGYPIAENYKLKSDDNKPTSFNLINNFLANWTFNADGWPQVKGFN
jgi:hypothetical protein